MNKFKYIIPIVLVTMFLTTACFDKAVEEVVEEKDIENLACSVDDSVCWWKLIKQEADSSLCQYLSLSQDQEKCFSYCSRIEYENADKFDDCSLLKIESDRHLCRINILEEKKEDFCNDVRGVQLCKDIFAWQNANNIKNCDVIVDEILKRECSSAFGDSQAEYDIMDLDNDGLTNLEETELGTNPKKADTDGDGFDDGVEVEGGFDPLKK